MTDMMNVTKRSPMAKETPHKLTIMNSNTVQFTNYHRDTYLTNKKYYNFASLRTTEQHHEEKTISASNDLAIVNKETLI